MAGGAKILSATVSDGTTGKVLELPSGATAIGPEMCVTYAYPTARTMIRSVSGSAGVALDVAYLSLCPPLVATGTITGSSASWGFSPVLSINPSSANGWRLAWFALIGTGQAMTAKDNYTTSTSIRRTKRLSHGSQATQPTMTSKRPLALSF